MKVQYRLIEQQLFTTKINYLTANNSEIANSNILS